MPNSAVRAGGIIAISEHTKKDAIRFTKANEDKIYVTHLAADERYKAIKDSVKLDQVSYKYGLTCPFIFYCGSLSPRKNIARLIKAFDLLKHKIPHRLVFTAGKSWKDGQIDRLIADLGLSNRIIRLGHVDSEVYLAGPAVAIASAIKGYITTPDVI